MSESQIKQIIEKSKIVAVVGLSKDPEKDSYRVAAYLQKNGYRIIPVNPTVDEVLGEKSYKSLLDLPVELQKNVDVVDVFRRSEAVLPIVEQAAALKVRFGRLYAIWMQLGIVNDEAAEVARHAGIVVVMNKCLMIEHRKLS